MARIAQAKPSHRRQRAHPGTIRVIFCRATGRAYTNETDAFLEGCDTGDTVDIVVPKDVSHLLYGETKAGSGNVVFSSDDAEKAFAWLAASVGASLTAMRVVRSHV